MNQDIEYKIFETTFGSCAIVFRSVGRHVKVVAVYTPDKETIKVTRHGTARYRSPKEHVRRTLHIQGGAA